MAGVGVPVPYAMTSIVPFPLAYSFLSGTAPGPNPPAQIPGVPVNFLAPNGAAGAAPNATFSYAPPIPGLQYFPSVTCPMPMGATSAPPNPPPGPSPLMPMSVGPAQATSNRPPPPIPPPGCSVTLQPLIHTPNSSTHQVPPLFVQQQQQQPQASSIRSPPTATGAVPNQALTPTQLHFLLAAYRVGIVALETLGRRAHDDRPQARYSRNPPYGEDVKWLLSVAKKLGTLILKCFSINNGDDVLFVYIRNGLFAAVLCRDGKQCCKSVCASRDCCGSGSFFRVHWIDTTESVHAALAFSSVDTTYSKVSSNVTLKWFLVYCLAANINILSFETRYIQCINHKLYHLNPTDYDDFLTIIQTARTAFHLIPTGPMQFNEFLQSIQK